MVGRGNPSGWVMSTEFRQFKHLTEVVNLKAQSSYASYIISTVEVPIWKVILMPDGQNHLSVSLS